MTVIDEQAQAALVGLVLAGKESEFAYLNAAKQAKDEKAAAEYRRMGEERAEIWREIENRLADFGGANVLDHERPLVDETGPPQQAAMDVPQAEEKTIRVYQTALETELPLPLREMAARQLKKIEEAKDRLRKLKGAPAAGNGEAKKETDEELRARHL